MSRKKIEQINLSLTINGTKKMTSEDRYRQIEYRCIINELLEFVYWQQKEGNIDGVCDPDYVIEHCKNLGFAYPPNDGWFEKY